MRAAAFFAVSVVVYVSCQPPAVGAREPRAPPVAVSTRLAVLDFEFQGLSGPEAEGFADSLALSVNPVGYEVIGRELIRGRAGQLELPTDEKGILQSRLELGKSLSAHQVIAGRIVGRPGLNVIHMDLIDVRSGATVNGVSNVYRSMDDLYTDGEALLSSLLTPPIRLRYFNTGDYVLVLDGKEVRNAWELASLIQQNGDLNEELRQEIGGFRAAYSLGGLLVIVGGILELPAIIMSGALTYSGSAGAYTGNVDWGILLIVVGGVIVSAVAGVAIVALAVRLQEPYRLVEDYNRLRTAKIGERPRA